MASFVAGSGYAGAMGYGAGAAVAAGVGAEVVSTAAVIPVYNELWPKRAHEHVKIVPLTDAAMASVDTGHSLLHGHKRKGVPRDIDEVLVNNVKQAGSVRKRLFAPTKAEAYGEEPDDPLVHSLYAGAGTSARLNYEGAGNNYCITEAEGEMVQSWDVDATGNFVNDKEHGSWSWQLSMSQLRYMSPFKEFMTIYSTYRIRQVHVEFYPIKLGTEYVVGSSKSTVDVVEKAVNEGAEAVDAAVDHVVTHAVDLKTIHELADDGKIPRVGPVAVCFIPKNNDMQISDTKLKEDTIGFNQFVRSTNAMVYTAVGDMLPTIKLEYDVPVHSQANSVGYRCPHPVSKYTEVNNLAVVEEAFPVLGTFHLRTSRTLGGIPLYSVRVKVLTEFMSVMDYPMDTPHRNPKVPLGEAHPRRRLSSQWHDPDGGLIEESDANELVEVVDSSDSTNSAGNSNPSNAAVNTMIAANTQNIAANSLHVSQLHAYRQTDKGRIDGLAEQMLTHGTRMDGWDGHVTVFETGISGLNESHGRHLQDLGDVRNLVNTRFKALTLVVGQQELLSMQERNALSARVDGIEQSPIEMASTQLSDSSALVRLSDISSYLVKPTIWRRTFSGTLNLQSAFDTNSVLFDTVTTFTNLATGVVDVLPNGNYTVRVDLGSSSPTAKVYSFSGTFFFNIGGTNDQDFDPKLRLPFTPFQHAGTEGGEPQVWLSPGAGDNWKVYLIWDAATSIGETFIIRQLDVKQEYWG